MNFMIFLFFHFFLGGGGVDRVDNLITLSTSIQNVSSS